MSRANDFEKKVVKFSDFKNKQIQLGLFETPFDDNKDCSNTIELYDAMPKYFWGKLPKRSENSNGDKCYLEPIERVFSFRDQNYRVVITPARIKCKDGVYRDHFPKEREDFVEYALRKLAYSGRHGCFLDDQASVTFSLYELKKELERTGHHYNINEIKEALSVCNETNIKLFSEDGKTLISSSLFITIGLQTREDWKNTGKKTKCFVQFNSLVTKSIKSGTYRQLGFYDTCMTYKNYLARYLQIRMSHLFTQASVLNPYTISLNTIIRDSGTKRYKSLYDNLCHLESALDEMKEKDVILHYKTDKVFEGRKLVDGIIHITVTAAFSKHMKKANKISQLIRNRAPQKINI